MNLKNKCIIFCVFFYEIWCLAAFVKVAYALFINQKSSGVMRCVPFIQATLVAVALITLAWLGHDTWRYATISFWYIVFLEVVLWNFNKLNDHVTYKNDI